MRHFLLILISSLTLSSCKGQNQEFVAYLSSLRNVELPLTIDTKTYNVIFYPNKNNHEIAESLVKKFICKDPANCVVNSSEYRYDYRVKFEYKNYYAALVHKQKYEGTTPYDFDLSEVILLVYSKQGGILSEQSIGKDNDGWISTIQITSNNIVVEQIKILEFNKPELSCEIEVKEYKINQDGIIKNTETKPVKKGSIVWNEQMNDFKLK
ncbi:MAG: hypothetical protein PHN55_13590 [Dysgonamonadaceae bacterium]|nr:hypothetical protein [Dysgonamonadaceae bacterium]